MHVVPLAAAFLKQQTQNIVRLLEGRSVNIIPLSSATLDIDDVKLAEQWLLNLSGWYCSAEPEEYNTTFARWNGSRHAFSFMSGRVALSACIQALDLVEGDEVIIPGYTCIVVQNAFQFAGIKTVFSDIELDTYGLDAKYIEEKITQRTKAILIHHLYGLVCRDYESLLEIANRRNLKVIEDCAHAMGAEHRGVKVGNRGHASFYSSEQSKVISTIQGGMAITNDADIARKLARYYQNAPLPDEQWIEKQLMNIIYNYYLFKDPYRWLRGEFYRGKYAGKSLTSTTSEEERGIRPLHYGRKMPPPIAALGLNQLKKIDDYNNRRRQTATKWGVWCEQHGYKKPVVINNSNPVFLRYPVLVEPEKKSDTSWALKELGIELGVWFVSNLHPVRSSVPDCPSADMAVRQCINFPTVLS